MDTEKVIAHIDKIFEEFKKDYIVDIGDRIDIAIANYKASIVIGDKWCCKAMEEIGTNVFHIHSRNNSNTFGTQLQIREHNMVYCPFCGVKL